MNRSDLATLKMGMMRVEGKVDQTGHQMARMEEHLDQTGGTLEGKVQVDDLESCVHEIP
jgi:hypothetical protein